MRKRYLLTQSNKMTLSVSTSKGVVSCEFSGSFSTPYRQRGYYTTEDAEVQKALEGHEFFGLIYVLDESYRPPQASKVFVKEDKEKPVAEAVKEYSLADARKELFKLGVKASEMSNKSKVLELAEKHGLTIKP